MGGGNVCTQYECEGLYYLDYELLRKYHNSDGDCKTKRELLDMGMQYDAECIGDYVFDEWSSNDSFDEMIDYMSEYITDRFKSFERVDKSVWHRRGLHIVLENRLFQIAVTDNEWSAAWMLIERDDIDDVGGNRNIMRRHYRTYLNCIKNALIDGFGEAIGYGGAWICGAVYRKEPVEARAAYARKGGGATVSAISGQTAG